MISNKSIHLLKPHLNGIALYIGIYSLMVVGVIIFVFDLFSRFRLLGLKVIFVFWTVLRYLILIIFYGFLSLMFAL